jgi:hypothetical protein
MKRQQRATRKEAAPRKGDARDERPTKAEPEGERRRKGGGNWAFIRFLLGNR